MSSDTLYRMILIYSCCIFSLAAENRFIVKKQAINEAQQQNQTNKKITLGKKLDISVEMKLQKNTLFIYSEKVHLKAIELLIFGFSPDIKLISHFLNSYKKNYSFNVHVIDEENESCFSSANKSEYFDRIDFNKSLTDSQNIENLTRLNQKIADVIERKRDSQKFRKSKSPFVYNRYKPSENRKSQYDLTNKFNNTNAFKKTVLSNKNHTDARNLVFKTRLTEDRTKVLPRKNSKTPSKNKLIMNKRISIDKYRADKSKSKSKQNNKYPSYKDIRERSTSKSDKNIRKAKINQGNKPIFKYDSVIQKDKDGYKIYNDKFMGMGQRYK